VKVTSRLSANADVVLLSGCMPPAVITMADGRSLARRCAWWQGRATVDTNRGHAQAIGQRPGRRGALHGASSIGLVPKKVVDVLQISNNCDKKDLDYEHSYLP
jgi:hypothetical protein